MVCQAFRQNDPHPDFDVKQARWVVHTLGLIMDVVGRQSILGMILRQSTSEIESLLETQAPTKDKPLAA